MITPLSLDIKYIKVIKDIKGAEAIPFEIFSRYLTPKQTHL